MGPHSKRRALESSLKDVSGCAIAGILCEDGRRLGGSAIIRMIANMHDRANGLGGGFAAYGIYPETAELYAFHLMFDDRAARRRFEDWLHVDYEVELEEVIPTQPVAEISDRPLLRRYFVRPRSRLLQEHYELTEEDVVVRHVMRVNAEVEGAFVFSSGRNMGIFKGVGYPEDIARFFRLEEYEAYLWTSHGRFPTNTTGWWGGAHPFGLLDWSVVHNGEISSYGINRRYLANYGYYCTMHTDTEVIAYLFDMLLRKHGLPVREACAALAPPFWSEIARMDPADAELARALRITYAGALLNGPFSVLLSHSGGMIGFNDRIKLRPMVAARSGQTLYVASEEASIREVCPDPERVWAAEGGVPVVGRLKSAGKEAAALA
ncbi:MAG: class II glutamine amidotransferase [Planctomycetota bacterium]